MVTGKEEFTMKRSTKITIAVFIGVVIMLILGVTLLSNRNYIKSDIFADISYMYSYENLKAEKGTQLKQMQMNLDDKTVWAVSLDGMCVVYSCLEDSDKPGAFMWAQIDSEAYTFGEQSVVVGMTRKDIEKIMRGAKRPQPSISACNVLISQEDVQQKTSEDYYDDNYSYGMGFVYDEKDCVEYILLYKGL